MIKGKTKEQLEARSAELCSDDNVEKWENGELGESEEHARVSSRSTTIRLSDDMIAALKSIAAYNGMPYQTYLKHILAVHIKEVEASMRNKESAKKKKA